MIVDEGLEGAASWIGTQPIEKIVLVVFGILPAGVLGQALVLLSHARLFAEENLVEFLHLFYDLICSEGDRAAATAAARISVLLASEPLAAHIQVIRDFDFVAQPSTFGLRRRHEDVLARYLRPARIKSVAPALNALPSTFC